MRCAFGDSRQNQAYGWKYCGLAATVVLSLRRCVLGGPFGSRDTFWELVNQSERGWVNHEHPPSRGAEGVRAVTLVSRSRSRSPESLLETIVYKCIAACNAKKDKGCLHLADHVLHLSVGSNFFAKFLGKGNENCV